jgi:hypothetical protein
LAQHIFEGHHEYNGEKSLPFLRRHLR